MADSQSSSGRILLVRAAAAAAVVLLVASLAVYAAFLTREKEIDQARTDFEHMAEHACDDLQRELESSVEVVRLTATIFNSSDKITRTRFAVFARGALSGREGLQALEFIPRVYGGERTALEDAVARSEIPGFAFVQRGQDGRLTPAAPRPEYFPVLYVEPQAGNETVLGFDLGSNPERMAALLKARDTGDSVASERIKLIQGGADSWSILLFHPVFPEGEPIKTREERERQLLGFALGVVQVDTLMRYAMVDIVPQAVSVALRDLSASGGDNVLFSRVALQSPSSGGSPSILPVPAMDISLPLSVGQRKLSLSFVSTPQFLASRLSWRPGLTLLAGLAITVLLGMYLAKSLRLLALSGAQVAEKYRTEIQLTDKIRQIAKAEREARDGERKLRAILSGIKAATFTVDAKTFIILDMNHVAEELFGVQASDWIGRPHTELLGRNLRPLDAPERDIQASPEDGDALAGGEFLLTRADGKLIPISRTVLSASALGGQYLFEVLFDISEKKALERQLGLAQKLESIGQLASGIAHEINTPIQYVGGNLGFLQDAFASILDMSARLEAIVSDAEAGKSVDQAAIELRQAKEAIRYEDLLAEIPGSISDSISGVDRVALIVGAMKKFSHPDAGGKRLVDVNKAIESTLTISRNEWKYDSEMRTQLDPDLPLVFCSPGDFNQVILNVVVNASHAVSDKFHGTGDKGLITVSTSFEEGMAVIRVSDTGVGIPPENLDRIFDPFFTTKEVGKGTGQGLAIVHSVVERHGGSIDIDSTPGQGTTFTIRFPEGQEGRA